MDLGLDWLWHSLVNTFNAAKHLTGREVKTGSNEQGVQAHHERYFLLCGMTTRGLAGPAKLAAA